MFGQVSGGLFAIPVSGGVAKPFLDQEVKVPAEANANAHDVSTSPDGKFIAMDAIPGSTGEDILVAPLDGRWLSFVSDESGRREVYVRAFPGPGGPASGFDRIAGLSREPLA